MDTDSEYFPKTPREKVMIYELLYELQTTIDRAQRRRILWIFPISRDMMGSDIREWMRTQYKLMAKDDE